MSKRACCFLINSSCCFCCCCCCLTRAKRTLCSIANFFDLLMPSSNSVLSLRFNLFASRLAPWSQNSLDFCSDSFAGELWRVERKSLEDIRGISILIRFIFEDVVVVGGGGGVGSADPLPFVWLCPFDLDVTTSLLDVSILEDSLSSWLLLSEGDPDPFVSFSACDKSEHERTL